MHGHWDQLEADITIHNRAAVNPVIINHEETFEEECDSDDWPVTLE
jgi:hypothetical protein